MRTTTAKKPASKTSVKPTGTTAKTQTAAHPTWVDMIKECIVAHPEDARGGVSRPTIKKFVESRYRIDLNATAASQLNRAITSGSERGTFLLPKGPSGKVKLAPKARSDAAKENATPIVKRPATKAKATPTKSSVAKKTPGARPVTKPRGNTTGSVTKANHRTTHSKPSATTTKTYTSAARKLQAKKSPAVTKKTAAKKRSASGKKTITAKKGAVKKTVIGVSKKPASKPRSKTMTAVKSKTRAAPSAKTKPSSKTTAGTRKPASRA